MTHQEEKYIHFVQCIENLNNSWRILQVIKDHKCSPILVGAAFQFALIEYSKSYKNSFGGIQNSKGKPVQYKLDEKNIPIEYLVLHNRILDARDQIHAHSDLTVWEAKLYVENTPHGKIAGQVRNIVYGTEELANIDSIIDLIEQTLDRMYEEVKMLKQQLPVNS